MEAHIKTVRVSPQKMRRFARMLPGKRVAEAEQHLQYIPTKPAKVLLKLLQSATSNATHNFNMKSDDLLIKTVTVDEGIALRRVMPRARGSADVLRKRTSHINIYLADASGKAKPMKGKRSDIVTKRVDELSAEELREGDRAEKDRDSKDIEAAPRRSVAPRVKQDASAVQKKGGSQ